MANMMFGRNVYFGTTRFAAPLKHAGAAIIDYPDVDGNFVIDFFDSEGQRVAQIVSDSKDSPLISAEFKLDNHGCADFTIVLARDHGIEIEYNQRVDIRLFGTAQPWYSGFVMTRPVSGTTQDLHEFSGYGYFQQLEHVIINRTFRDAEITDIARNLIIRDIESEIGANFNDSKLTSTDYIASYLNFDHATAKDCLKQLSEFAVNYIYGVDEFRDIYFKPLVTEINENSRFWVGFHVHKFIPEEDTSTIVNYIYVQGGTLDSGGSNIMTEIDSPWSISKYGKRSAVLSIPSAFSEHDARNWGRCELEKNMAPKRTAKVDGIIPEILKRNIRPEGMARITSFDGKFTQDYPIKNVSYKLSSEGITMKMELGEYTKALDQIILKMTRDARNVELLQRGNNAQLV